MRCHCGRTLATNVPQRMECKCGAVYEVGETDPHCGMCGNKLYEGACKPCDSRRDEINRCLAICRSNVCGHYDDFRNSDRCLAIADPCKLRVNIAKGHQCELGFHDEVIDVSRFVADDFDRKDEVAIITFHFNVAGYDRLRETYQQWVPSLGPLRERLIVMECALDDDPQQIEGSTVIRGTRKANGMWQKEALFNEALRRLPASVRYVAWMDKDIVIQDSQWLAGAIDLIDGGAVAVQLWDRVKFLDREHIVTHSKPGGVSTFKDRGHTTGCPGGSWIADRSFLDDIGGLLYSNIVGGSDQAFYQAMVGLHGAYLTKYSQALESHDRAWIERTHAAQGDRSVECLPTTGVHFWHGDRSARQYQSRTNVFTRNDFDPLEDIRVGESGLLEWGSDKPELRQDVYGYFANRKDDG